MALAAILLSAGHAAKAQEITSGSVQIKSGLGRLFGGGVGSTTPTLSGVSGLNAALGDVQDMAVDASGNVYFTTASSPSAAIYEYVAASGTVKRIAGGGANTIATTPSAASDAAFPAAIFDLALDTTTGNLYVSASGNPTYGHIYKITGLNSVGGPQISIFAGQSASPTVNPSSTPADPLSVYVGSPRALSFDASGNLWVGIGGRGIAKITGVNTTPQIVLISKIGGSGPTSTPQDASTLYLGGNPLHIAFDLAGNLYYSDSSIKAIVKVTVTASTPQANIILGAGTQEPTTTPTSADQIKLGANSFSSLVADSAGNLYVNSKGPSSTSAVVRITNPDTAPMASIYIGGGAQSPSNAVADINDALLAGPFSLAISPAGDLYIAAWDLPSDRGVYKTGMYGYVRDTAVGASSTGTALVKLSADTTLSSVSSSSSEYTLGTVTGCTLDGTTTNTAGSVCTIPYTFTPTYAGQRPVTISLKNGSTIYGTVGMTGLGTGAQLTYQPATISAVSDPGISSPVSRTFAPDGSYYIYALPSGKPSIYHVVGGTATLVAGGNGICFDGTQPCGDGGLATSASLSNANGMTTDSAGNLYFTDNNARVRKVDASTGIISTIIGTGQPCYSTPCGTGGVATSVKIYSTQLALDKTGNVYLPDSTTNVIWKYTASTGMLAAVAGIPNSTACSSNCDGALATSTKLDSPFYLAVDAANNIYFTGGPQRVMKVTASTGILSTIAGTGFQCSSGACGDGGAATSATMFGPAGIAVDAAGNVYFADQSNNRIRKINAADGIINTIVGNGTACAPANYATCGDGGNALAAKLKLPTSVAVDFLGNLQFFDSGDNIVRKVTFATAPSFSFATATTPGTVDTTDGTLALTLSNIGNAALSLPIPGAGLNPSIAQDFQLASGSSYTCPTVSSSASVPATLASGGACSYGIQFAPVSAGTISGSLALTDNALTSTTTTQNFSLSGNAVGPVLDITLSHTGNFLQGSSAREFTILVTNSGNAATSGNITVAVNLPSGLSDLSLSGTGWDCSSGASCTYAGTLATGESSTISAFATADSDAPASVVNSATVSGGGAANKTGTDTILIDQAYFTVDSTDDPATPTAANCSRGHSAGSCTLRDAIAAANLATLGNISFDSTVFHGSKTITLTQGVLPVTGPSWVTINGYGADQLTISGNNASAVFDVSASALLRLFDITVTKGSGSAITSAGTVYLNSSAITNSWGPQGGGIFLSGSGELHLHSSTVSGNSSTNFGGGIAAFGSSTTLEIQNSTIYGNTAGTAGGGIYSTGTSSIINATVAGNQGMLGGGVYAPLGITMSNSIVAGNNTTSTPKDDCNCAGTLTSNLINTDAQPVNAMLSPLGYYGGHTQTVLPLPGSPALRATSLAASAVDQRGATRNISGTKDIGSVQTSYTLSFSTQPAASTATATDFTAAVQLKENGSTLSFPSAQVVSIPVSLSGSGTLSGSPFASLTTSGIAAGTFQVSAAGTGDKLTAKVLDASSNTIASATSSAFDVLLPVSKLGFGTAPASTATVGASTFGTITVQELNSSDAVVTGATDAITLTITNSAASYSQTLGPVNAVAGVASFDTSALSFTASGTYTFTATATSITSATATSTIAAGAATHFGLNTVPSGTYVGSDLVLSIQALDAYENIATAYSGTVHFTSSGASDVLPADAGLTNGSGIFSFTPNTVGTVTVTATDTVTSSITAQTTANVLAFPKYIVTVATDITTGVQANCTDQTLASATLDANCSLRDAIAAANAHAAPRVSIIFDGTAFATAKTITLTNGVLNLTHARLTISGPGQELLTISANDASQIFTVDAAATNVVTEKMSLVHGKRPLGNGGAIEVAGSLTLNDATLSNNSADNFGGAIAGTGNVTIYRSTFSNNNAYQGGAVSNVGGSLYMEGSTIAANTSTSGGGIFLTGANAVIRNTTLVKNKADGGDGGAIQAASSTLTTQHVTIASNTARAFTGIASNTSVSLIDSIVVDDAGSAATGVAPTYTGAYNIVGGGPYSFSPLGNYGGPTQTVLPLPGNPAIGGGSNIGITTDQRGFARTGSRVDAGAVQTNYGISFSTQPPSSIAINTDFSAAVTLTESGNAFPVSGTVSIPLTLNGSGTLAGAFSLTNMVNGVVSTSSLQVDTPAAADTLTATALSGVTAESSAFDVLGTIDMSVTMSHTGNFQQGGNGTYSITVKNDGNINTSGSVSVSITLPAGLTAVSLSSADGGWSCSTMTSCSRSDALAPSASYASLTLTVDVDATAAASLQPEVTVSNTNDTNSSNDTATDTTTIDPVVTLSPGSLSDATVGQSYSATLSAGGGSGAYTFSVSAGSLPAGLTLSPAGVLSGTPTAGGSFSFSITASDTGVVASKTIAYTLSVSAPTISVSPTSQSDGKVADVYSASLSATGGTGPYTYAVTSGALPAGVTLSSSGALSGTPTAGGSFNVTITATDSSTGTGPFTGSRSYTLLVAAPSITLASSTLPVATNGVAYSTQLTATGSIAPYTYSVVDGTLPSGITLSAGGVLSGTTTATPQTYSFTVRVTDAATNGSGHYTADFPLSLTLNPAAPIANDVSASVLYGSTNNAIALSVAGGTAASVSVATAPSHGTATANGTSITYTPVATYTGTDTFTYTATNVTGTSAPATVTVQVGKIPVTVTLTNLAQTYKASPVAVSATTVVTSSGTPVNVAAITYTYNGSTTAPTHYAAGGYVVAATVNDPVYQGTASGTLTIDKAPLTVTAPTLTKVYGAAMPALSGTYSGQQGADTFTVTGTTTATASSPAGDYTISPSAAGTNLADYTVTSVNGKLTITRAPSVTALTVSGNAVNPTQTVTLTANVTSSTSGTPTGTVNFYDGQTLLNSTPVALSQIGTASFSLKLASGTHALTASYAGEANFAASSSTASAGSTVSVAALDFNLTINSGANEARVIPGGSANFTFGVTPTYGAFPAPVSFTATGLPPGATYSFSPATLAANSTGSDVTLTIQVPHNSASVRSSHTTAFSIALGMLLLPFAAARRFRKMNGRAYRLALILLCAAFTVAATGCGASNGILSSSPQTYQVNVTATSGTVQHTTTVTLHVD